MKKSCSCLGLMVLVLVLGLLAVLGYLIVRGTSKVAKEGNLPPTVIVNSPGPNETITAGSFMMANVTATGQNPIARIELWLDGSLLETQSPTPELGEVTTFYVTASIPMTEGPHMFSARAVDSKGLVGQSFPLVVQGGPRAQPEPGPTGPSPTAPGQTGPGQAGPGQTGPGQTTPPTTGGGSTQPPPVTTIPPAPLPVTPPGVKMATIKDIGIAIDINSLLPILLSGRPKAPTSLQAGYENCKIRLIWMDNADNEAQFNVWMQALGGPPRVIATLKGTPKTGPAWYEFASPWTGIYSFWIEAANVLGGQSSEIAWVGVTDLNCGPGVATHLNIEIKDMYVPGGYDQVYCYLSVEGAPEKRTPATDGTYIPASNGFVDVSNWTGSGNKILVPIPSDNEITLEGKCLGRKGAAKPDTLGTFSASAPKETWDGRRLELKPKDFAGYTIGYRIQYHGPAQVITGDYKYTDYTIPAPTDLLIKTQTSSNPASNATLARIPTLQWTWSGDATKLNLTGFTLIVDGKSIQGANQVQIGSGKWEDTFFLPTACGGTYKFQVAANAGNAQSPPSAVYEHKQPLCEIYAEIKFETITFTDVDDGAPGSCDTANAYYNISVNGEERQFGEFEGADISMDCGTFYFSRLPALMPQEHKYTSVDTFYVPISAQNSSGNMVFVSARFIDNDPSLFDDADDLCIAYGPIDKSSQEWVNLSTPESIQFSCSHNGQYDVDAQGYVTISVRGVVAAADTSRSANPGIGPPVGP